MPLRVRIGEFGVVRELSPSSLTDRLVERWPEIAEEGKGPSARPFLAHEQKRDLGRQQHDHGRRMHQRLRRVRPDPGAKRRVADLVMVLQKRDENGRRQMGRRLAARMAVAMFGGLALIGETGGEGAPELLDRALGVIAVISPRLAGQQNMQRVMQIVIPLRRIIAREPPRLVAVVFEDQMNGAARDMPANRLRQFGQDIGRALIENGVHGVKTQPVEVKFLEPVEGVVHDEIAHRRRARPVIIDRRAPGRVVPLGEEIGRDRVQVIPFRAEMVVDDIEEYRDAARMAFIDKRLQLFRPAIVRAGREPLDAVISPITAPRTFGDRHQFDRGNAELNEMIEMRDRAGKVTTLRKGSEMQLIDHQFVPRPAIPSGIAPFVSRRVDDLAGAMHAVGLIA